LNAAHLVGDEPFIYTYADDFFVANPSRTKQLIEVFQQRDGGSVLACKRVREPEEYERYGIVAGESLSDQLLKVSQIVEKPGIIGAPSDLASVSGYLFTPDIFKFVEQAARRLEPGQELMIQTAIQAMIDNKLPVYAVEIKNGTYHDTGNKLDYLKTVVEFALQHKELNNRFKDYLRTVDL
jgi:UTP--glucose-1-phosphate uridylyltransferase